MSFLKSHRFVITYKYTATGMKHLGSSSVTAFFLSRKKALQKAHEMDWTKFQIVSVRRTSERIYIFPFIQTIRNIRYRYRLLQRKRNQVFALGNF